jgi:hypothetical protein
MRNIFLYPLFAILSVIGLVCTPIGYGAEVASPTPAPDPTEFLLSSTAIGAFDYGSQALSIWASLNNRDEARVWQFRYEPLFAPEVNKDSQLDIETKAFGSKWRTSLTINLDSQAARAQAYAKLLDIYPTQAHNIQSTSVFVMPIRHLSVDIPDLAALSSNAKLVDTSLNFDPTPPSFTLVIESPDEKTARDVEKNLGEMKVKYTFSFAARTSDQNWVKFSFKTLKDSQLYARLNGLNTTSAYVHRDDMRKLLEGINNQVEFDQIIEKPDDFENGLFDKLLARFNTSADSKDLTTPNGIPLTTKPIYSRPL